jgi:hypothetical protein
MGHNRLASCVTQAHDAGDLPCIAGTHEYLSVNFTRARIENACAQALRIQYTLLADKRAKVSQEL